MKALLPCLSLLIQTSALRDYTGMERKKTVAPWHKLLNNCRVSFPLSGLEELCRIPINLVAYSDWAHVHTHTRLFPVYLHHCSCTLLLYLHVASLGVLQLGQHGCSGCSNEPGWKKYSNSCLTELGKKILFMWVSRSSDIIIAKY